MAKIYRVIGRFNGIRVNEIVEAESVKQAKLRAGFSSGFGGRDLSEFMKSRKIKVRRKK